MLWPRRRWVCCLMCAFLAGSSAAASANETSFPFGSALLLDAAPQPGSKRIPTVEIDQDGMASFYLWCASVRGSAKVGADTISMTPTTPLPSQCSAEQINRDAALLAQLAQVTGWRRNGDEVDFLGTTTLRFRLMTN
jgi:META domain